MLDKITKLLSNKKISISLFIAFIIGLFVWFIFYNSRPLNNQIIINNFDAIVKNLPPDQKDAIFASLYSGVKLNKVDDNSLKNIHDATIRDGSAVQNYDQTTQVYTGNFIVDIASIKQSYKINYVYSTTNNTLYEAGTPISTTCLNTSLLIYGDFNCTDLFIEQRGTAQDPILSSLPYKTISFEVRANADNNGNFTGLIITISLYQADKDSGVMQAVAKYKADALSWIQSQGFDPAKYTITYKVYSNY